MKKKLLVQDVDQFIRSRELEGVLAHGQSQPIQISKEKLAFLVTHYLNSLGDFANASYRAERISRELKECEDHSSIDHVLEMELQGSLFQQMFHQLTQK